MDATMVTKKIRVYGIVQGVGFRPTVSRHAAVAGITGSVCNCGPYVEILAQGTTEQVGQFLDLLEKQPPKRAAILKIHSQPVVHMPRFSTFEIIESEKKKGEIFISPDIAVCEECKEELFDPTNRRYLHPFINCTCCGPRLTILDALPYDRERTSMKEFPMCSDCAEEYENPESRRYDAQPVCCPECGPQLYELPLDTEETMVGADGVLHNPPGRTGGAAITEARRIVSSGGIIAVKGIGGFHLCCDATDSKAVELLRKRKTRPVKPFAIMAKNMEAVRRECVVEACQEDILTGHQKPIVLLRKRTDGAAETKICREAAPGNPKLGVMLPYAPVQLLLFDYDDGIVMPDCLVMTSANASGAPICRDDRDALRELKSLCDYILSNDRKIRIRSDDTVMDFVEGKPYMIRRSRGFAPLPFLLTAEEAQDSLQITSTVQDNSGGKSETETESNQVLALGGELKNSFCLGINDLYYPSPYVGDLADLRTVQALKETTERFQTLLEMQPELVACDLHPGYNSTAAAEALGLPVVKIQHHYAHILSCMAENDYAGRTIGVAFDGTGYGEDGTVWGGEILLADYDGYRRVGSIVPFDQCGGDRSAKEGWRIAASLLYDLTEDGDEAMKLAQRLQLCSAEEMKMTAMMKARGINTVRSTSAGRIFDAVSAILGICRASTFEGEASMKLQFAAERAPSRDIRWPGAASENQKSAEEMPDETACAFEPCQKLRTDQLVRWILEQHLSGVPAGELAYAFHAGLAEEILRVCKVVRADTGCNTVALSGGVFQNTLLLQLTADALRSNHFELLLHSMVPPNDGGIALGQAAAAMHILKKKKQKA